ncbi:MAG: phosphoglycolate phosphatase [Pseudomonadota bacterium]
MSVAVVLDLDGTLIDSAPDIHAAANAALGAEGVAPLSLDEARSFVGAGTPTFVRRAMAARGIDADRFEPLHAAFLGAYEGAVALTAPYPGAVDALAVLAGRGHPMGLCTNKPIGPTRTVLEHFRLAHVFGAVMGGDSLAVRKPDPAPLHAVMEGLGASTCLYVGDSEVDAETAARAGVPFLLFTEGYRKTPVEDLPHAAAFSHWDVLPGLVTRLAGGAAA